MTATIDTTTTLNNGIEMPLLGLGVFQSKDGQEVINAINWALEAGYRLIDTAASYRNEAGVGTAIRQSDIPREQIFVTTKVWNNDQRADRVLEAFDESLAKLGLDYIDLYLIHWPVAGKYKETWRHLESLLETERVRAIGVSNFMPHHLADLMQDAQITPAVNQIEFHPRLQQPDLLAACRQYGIVPQAWSPIMKGRVMDVPELVAIGNRYGKTAVQVTLKWMLQRDLSTIPKSAKESRIRANGDLSDFTLTEDEIGRINQLDTGERIGPDPDNFSF